MCAWVWARRCGCVPVRAWVRTCLCGCMCEYPYRCVGVLVCVHCVETFFLLFIIVCFSPHQQHAAQHNLHWSLHTMIRSLRSRMATSQDFLVKAPKHGRISSAAPEVRAAGDPKDNPSFRELSSPPVDQSAL